MTKIIEKIRYEAKRYLYEDINLDKWFYKLFISRLNSWITIKCNNKGEIKSCL